jgi:hypothetical protein
MKQVKSFIMLLIGGVLFNASFAQGKMAMEDQVTVGGAAMYPTKNIIENAINQRIIQHWLPL